MAWEQLIVLEVMKGAGETPALQLLSCCFPVKEVLLFLRVILRSWALGRPHIEGAHLADTSTLSPAKQQAPEFAHSPLLCSATAWLRICSKTQCAQPTGACASSP